MSELPMLDFQTALTRLAPTTGGLDPFRSFRPGDAERACLEVLRQSAGFRFTAAVQHSWCARRAVNAGLLALSIMHDDARRRLLGAWIRCGGGTSSLFAAEADALLEFIAEQLPDPSPELAVCRFEQLTLRANDAASSFTAPDRPLFELRRIVRQGRHAGVVLFHGEPDMILNALWHRKPLPDFSPEVTPLLVAPGLKPLCRIASRHELELWNKLAVPMVSTALEQDRWRRDAIETMLHVGALEFA